MGWFLIWLEVNQFEQQPQLATSTPGSFKKREDPGEVIAPVGGRSDRDLNLGQLNNSANFAAFCTNLVFKNGMSVS